MFPLLVSSSVLPTLGGLAVSDHEGSRLVPGGQQLPLGIFPANALEEPPRQQETDQLVQKPLNGSSCASPLFPCVLRALLPRSLPPKQVASKRRRQVTTAANHWSYHLKPFTSHPYMHVLSV